MTLTRLFLILILLIGATARAAPPVRIGQAADEAGTFRDAEGNPFGEAHVAHSYTTRPALQYGANTAGVATANGKAIGDHYAASPMSGVYIDLPADLVLDRLVNPAKAVPGGTRLQHLNFAIRGTRPGVTVVCREPTLPAVEFKYFGFPSHRPTTQTYQQIENLDFVTRTPLKIDGLGMGFWAHNVTVRSDTTGWDFRTMYAAHVGRIKAIRCKGIGFEFENCNQFSADQIMARDCVGGGIKAKNCSALNINIDAESNGGFALDLIRVRDSHVTGWMEFGRRVRLARCSNITQQCKGFHVEEADKFSRTMCPALFGVTRTPMPLTGPIVKDQRIPMQPLADTVSGWHERGCEIKFRVTKSTPSTNGRVGWIMVNANGEVPLKWEFSRDGVYSMRGYVENETVIPNYIELKLDAGAAATVEILSVERTEAGE